MQKKDENGKKKKKILLILIPILAAALVAGGIFAITKLGKKGPAEEPSEPGETLADSTIWYNVDKDFYYQMTEGGMSSREPEDDGQYHVLLAFDGEESEYLVEKYKLVNMIDNWDLACFVFDEEGKYIVEMKRPEDCGYTLLVDSMYVASVDEDGTVIYNVQENLGGIEAPYTPAETVKVMSLAEDAKVVGDKTDVLKTGDRITVYQKDGVDYIFVFKPKPPIAESLYWNVTRMWDSELLATSRKPDENGDYVFELAVNGEVKTFKTKIRDVASDMDNVAGRNFGLKFDKQGYVVKRILQAEVTGGGSIASWHTVINLEDDGMSFHAKKLSATAKDYGNEEDIEVTDETLVYCVNDMYSDHYGERTLPKVGDTVHCVRDGSGKVVVIFIVSRKGYDDVYWNVERKYDSTTKETSRTPEADGYYYITFAVNGAQKVLKCKDKALVTRVDTPAGKNMALKLEGDEIVGVYYSAQSYVAGLYGSRASWATVTRFNNAEKTEFHTKKLNEGSDKGTELDSIMSPTVKIYNVSTNFEKFMGEATTLQVGDVIHCLTNLKEEVEYIFVVTRKTSANIYWNCTRKYDSNTKQTTRTPEADGYYHISMTTNGQKPVDLITRDKAIATKVDSYAGRNMGIVLAGDGRTIAKVIATSSVAGVGSSTASWTDVTSVSGGGFKSHKSETAGTTYDGQDFDIKYVPTTKIYNVSSAATYSGQPDKVQVGDVVHVVTDLNNDALIVYIVTRPIRADIYWNVERMYNSTTKETTRTPAADGFYHIMMTTGGKKPTELIAKTKEIATKVDSYAGKNMGIKLEADGKTISAVYPTSNVNGYTGSSTASWTDVTSLTANGFISHKAEGSGTSYDGQNFTITLTSATKIYNVSGFYDGDPSTHYVGEPTTVRVGDKVHVERDGNKKPAIVFVVGRSYAITDHANTHVCQGCGEAVTWTPWTKASELPTSAGHYYLCGDVTMAGTANTAKNAHVAICLNGHTVTGTTQRVTCVEGAGSDLVLCDCTGKGGMKFPTYGGGDRAGFFGWSRYGTLKVFGGTYDMTGITTNGDSPHFFSANGTTLELHDVTMIGGTSTKTAGAVRVTAGSTVILENITVKDAKGKFGEMIYVADTGKLILKGTLNFSGVDKTAIYVAQGGEVYLDGLTDTENASVVLANKTGQFTMNYEDGAEKFFTCEAPYTIGKGDGTGLYIGTGAATGISADVTSLSLRKEQQTKLSVNVTPETASDRVVTFESSDPTVVTVDSDGNVKAASDKEGMATITAKVEGTDVKVEIPVTVAGDPIEVTKITLNATAIEMNVGGASQLTATLEPAEASYQKVSYVSSDESVATVDADGNVTAVSQGTATITAKAEVGSATATVSVTVSAHDHCICGGSYEGEGHTHASASWEAWTSDTTLPTATSNNGKYFYLTKDVTLSDIQYFSGTVVTICLNGHKITGAVRPFYLQSGASVTITDCADGLIKTVGGSGAGMIYMKEKSTMNFYGGTLDASEFAGSYGLCSYLYDSGNTLNIFGGKFIGGKTPNQGGCIYLGKTDVLNIYGGEIIGGTATSYSGAINAGTNSTVNIYGGTIKDGTAQSGGNISVCSGAVVNMYGGTISGGTAVKSGTDGGFGGNVSMRTGGTFNMYGGTIEKGTAQGSVGGNVGLYTTNSAFNLYGGLITGGKSTSSANAGGIGSFYTTTDGSVRLAGGKVTGNDGGVYIAHGSVIVEGNPYVLENNTSDLYLGNYPMTLGDTELTAKGTIGLTASISNTFLPSDKDYSEAFVSADENYDVIYDAANKIHKFGVKISEHTDGKTHCVCGGQHNGEDGHACAAVSWTKWEKTDSLPTAAGNYYLTADIDLGTHAVTIPDGLALCLNGHTVTASKKATVAGKFTACDCSAATLNGISNQGAFVLTVDGPTEDLFVTESDKVQLYDVKNTNTDKETVVDLTKVSPEDAANMKIDIYIIAGQSNAAGSTTLESAGPLDRDYNVYNNVSYYYFRRNTDGSTMVNYTDFGPVKEGLANTSGTHIGPELGMARVLNDLYAGTDKQAVILKSAAGGTSVYYHIDDDGNPVGVSAGGTPGSDGKTSYERFVERGSWYPLCEETEVSKARGEFRPTGFLTRELGKNVQDAYDALLALGYKAENINFVALNWMQGETDRSNSAIYEKYFTEVTNQIKGYISDTTGKDYSNLPIVVGEISNTFSSASTSSVTTNTNMNCVLGSLGTKIDNLVTIRTKDFAVNELVNGTSVPCGTDESHWNYRDAVAVGELFGEAAYDLGHGLMDHVHCICGDNKLTAGGHVHKNLIWTEWNKTDSLPLGGAVYLTEDVTLTKQQKLVRSELYVDLNGHTITIQNIGATLHSTESNIVFTDCSDKKGKIVMKGSATSGGGITSLRYDASLTVIGIEVDASAYSNNYGNVAYTDNTTKKGTNTVNFYNATLKGGKATSGCIVFVNSLDKLNAYNSTFVGGETTSHSASVYFGGSGVIEDCTFTGGKTAKGSALYISNSESVVELKNVTATGGLGGGAIYVNSGKLTVAGKMNVTGNEGGNIGLSSSGKLELGAGGLDTASKIGVTAANGQKMLSSATDLTAMVTSDTSTELTYDATNKVHVTKASAVHSHCVCGGIGAVGDHTSCTNVTWTAVSTSDDLVNISTVDEASPKDVYVYLANDITVSKNISIRTNMNLHICLNGYTLSGPTNSRVFSTYNAKPGSISVCDCSTAKSGKITAKGTLGSSSSALQGPIALLYNAGSSFTVYGGTLENGNVANHYAGAICVANGTTFRMYGGKIQNCKCAAIGTTAVYGKGGALYIDGTAYLYGGTITGNEAQKEGDNIYVKGTLYVGGTAVVEKGASDNICVDATGKLLPAPEGFKTGAKIYVSPTSGATTFLPSDKDLSAYVLSDSASKTVVYDSTNKVHKFAETVGHAHCVCGGLGTTGDHTTCANVNWTKVSTEAELRTLATTAKTETTEIYVYLDDDITFTGGAISLAKNVHFFLCLNGHTVTGQKDKRVFEVNGSGTAGLNVELNICDCSDEKTGVIQASPDSAKSAYSGGVLLVYTEGRLNIYGGTIQNGKPAEQGGNISLQGPSANPDAVVCNLYGGTVKNGLPVSNGGNIFVNGAVFNMYGGTVTGGKATQYGGNIYISSTSKVTIAGGTISDGTTTDAASDSAMGGGNIGILGTGSLTVSGGTVTNGKVAGNTNNRYGGNIYVGGSTTVTVSGGTVSGGAPLSSADTKLYGANLGIAGTTAVVNISGGTFTGGVSYCGGNIAAIGGSCKLNISGGKFEKSSSVSNGFNIYQSSGTTTISGGTFEAKSGGAGQGVDCGGDKAVMNISDGQFNCYTVCIRGKMNVSGGQFTNTLACLTTNTHTLTVTGGKFVNKFDTTVIVPAGYKVNGISETIGSATYKYQVVPE